LKQTRYIDFICTAAFLAVTSIGSYATYTGLNLYQSRQDFLISELLSTQASILENRLQRALSATQVLSQEVKQNGGMFADFEEFAEALMPSFPDIASAQLAPGGITRHIYPPDSGHIGRDLLKDAARSQEAQLTVESRKMTLAGPFELTQGGIGMVGRNPIFLYAPNGTDKFWGFASVVIYLDTLLQTSDLEVLEQKGIRYQLSRTHPATGLKQVFARSGLTLNENSLSIDIQAANAEWQLSMSPATPYSTTGYWAGYSISTLFALLIASLLRRVLRQPLVLQHVVEEQTRTLHYQANYDQLTGLANRFYFSEEVERACKECIRHHQKAALIIFDLDDFKQINDIRGHDTGDALLLQIAERLDDQLLREHLVARLGGDEFAILIHDLGSTDSLSKLIDSLRNRMTHPIVVNNNTFSLTASFGIAVIPQDGARYTTAYRHADMAMYAAKKGGKNRYAFYNERLQQAAEDYTTLQHALATAIDQHELRLHMQPIIDLRTNQVAGYEALVRWQHPVKGLLGPDNFIGLAEESQLIFKLGYWVFEEACRQIHQYKIDGWVAINLSPRQFNDPQLVKQIISILQAHNISPGQIELEVTESCLIDSIDDAITTLQALCDAGLSISLDDFGTGYSSLALLKRLPVKKLKIDRSFIQDLDMEDRKIVQAMTGLAHTLDMKVVAEGIEETGQLHILNSMHCDFGQGYLFSKPKPMEELLNF